MSDVTTEREGGTIDRETLLDVSVNIIPMGILLFFIVLFLAYRPWGTEGLEMSISMVLLVVHFPFLGLLTYVAAKKIEEGEP